MKPQSRWSLGASLRLQGRECEIGDQSPKGVTDRSHHNDKEVLPLEAELCPCASEERNALQWGWEVMVHSLLSWCFAFCAGSVLLGLQGMLVNV